mmetsp:Transcript_46819/g.85737  ORF Transcript_46819/g.85737 Transcript_46819/m.85737 type:complete len:488 (-) Transcript_46819:45-1508(-)
MAAIAAVAGKHARDRKRQQQRDAEPEPAEPRNPNRRGLFGRSVVLQNTFSNSYKLRILDLMERQERVRKTYTGLRVQAFVAVLIGGNFLVNIVEKQLDPKGDQGMEHIWYPFELFFNIAFTVELMVNLFAHWWRPFWRSSWNVFDLMVVSIGILTTVKTDLPGPLKLLRIIRAFRVFRLFKRVKSLNRIMQSLTRAVPGVANAFLILVLVMSIYAILGVDLFKEHGKDGVINNESGEPVEYWTPRGQEYGDEYFGNFLKAWYTMFQVLTTDSWNEAVGRPLVHQDGSITGIGCGLFFTSFSVVVAIVLVNVMVAVLLEKMVDEGPPPDPNEQADKAAEERMSMVFDSDEALWNESEKKGTSSTSSWLPGFLFKAEAAAAKEGESSADRETFVQITSSTKSVTKSDTLGTEVASLKLDIDDLKKQLDAILHTFQRLAAARRADHSPERLDASLRAAADVGSGAAGSSMGQAAGSVPGQPEVPKKTAVF